MKLPLLQISDLRVRYSKTEVLSGVDLQIQAGEIVGIAGESGSGKTTLAMSTVRLVEHFGGKISGKIIFDDKDVLSLTTSELRQLRGRHISLVFQNATGALNPVSRVGGQFRDVCKAHGKYSREQVRLRARELLKSVQLPTDDSFLNLYPSQLSGGMAQRLVLALALVNGPQLLIADEPTSNLDVTIEGEIIDLFRRLRGELGLSMLFISHNLTVLAGLCDRVAILHQGKIVETATTRQLFESPQHPYTQLLLSSIPRVPFITPFYQS